MKSELIDVTREIGQRKVGQTKHLCPPQELNPWPPEHQVGTLSTELQQLMESKVI